MASRSQLLAMTLERLQKEKVDINRKTVKAVVEAYHTALRGALKKKDRAPIGDIGALVVVRKKAVKGGMREIFGEMRKVAPKPAKDVPKFRFARSFRDAVEAHKLG